MKRLTLLVCCVLLPFLAVSQNRGESPRQHITFGIKGSVNLASMRYTDWHMGDLPQKTVLRPVGGLFVDLPVLNWLSIAPELMYVERGMETVYTHYSGYEVDYAIRSRYVDFRLPLLLGINVTSWLQPYLVVGGDVGYLLGGEIQLKQTGLPNPELSVDLGKANMKPLYLGAFGGLGLRFFYHLNGQRAHVKVEATYHREFLDTFSEMEHNDQAHPENVNAYNITGKRFPQGIEFTLGVTLPLIPGERDACYNFSRNKWR